MTGNFGFISTGGIIALDLACLTLAEDVAVVSNNPFTVVASDVASDVGC